MGLPFMCLHYDTQKFPNIIYRLIRVSILFIIDSYLRKYILNTT